MPTGMKDAAVVTVDGNMASCASPSPPVDAGEARESDAGPSPAAGKRPMSDGEESEGEEGGDQADDDASAPPRKKVKKDLPEGDASDGVDEGEVDSDGVSKVTASASVDESDATASLSDVSEPAAPAGGWNNGVNSGGLRTSFGTASVGSGLPTSASSSTQKTKAPTIIETMHRQLTTDERNQLVTAIRANEGLAMPPLSKRGLSWTVNPFKVDAVKGDTWLGVLRSMLDQFCKTFVAENCKNIDEVGLTPSILKRAVLRRLEVGIRDAPRCLNSIAKSLLKHPERSPFLKDFAPYFKPIHKKDANRLGEEFSQQIANSSEMAEEQRIRINPSSITDSKATTTTPADESPGPTDVEMEIETKDGENGDNGPVHAFSEGELDKLHRYYPGIPDHAVFCLTCASYGHRTASCPETSCKFCQQDHFSYECPSRQRCHKCKQLGHTQASCKERLAQAPGEGFIECAFCQAQDHQEETCTEIWQTYRPQIGSTRKVKSLPIFCYSCGAEGHFGTDCGLVDRSILGSGTWTTATAMLYIDPASSEEAIAFKNPLPLATASSAPFIPGRSIKPQSHIIFEESDDEGEADDQGFIRAPATGLKRPGQIQITSNINFGTSTVPSPHQQQQSQTRQQPSSKKPRKPRNKQPQTAPLPDPRQMRASAPAPRANNSRKKNRNGGNNGQQQPPLPPGPPPSLPPPSASYQSRSGNGNGSGWRPPAFIASGPNQSQGKSHSHQPGPGSGARGRGGFSNLGSGSRGRPRRNRDRRGN